MSEAKPQDGSTVKGYRTLTAGDIERMNRLKGVSRHFCSLLDTERGELLAVRNGPAMLSAEQAREIDEAMRSGNRPHQNAGSLYVGLPCSRPS